MFFQIAPMIQKEIQYSFSIKYDNTYDVQTLFLH